MKSLFSFLGPGRLVALGICAVLGVLAVYLKFFIPGYSFSALVCLCLIAVILFYAFFPLLGVRFPGFVRWTERIVTAVLVLGVLVVGITEGLILHASYGNPDKTCQYMVVLGAKVRDDGPSVSLWDRIYGARNYMLEQPQVIAIVSGGQGPDEPMTEAACMYDALVAMGISPERIWLEDRASSTWEHLNFSLNLIEEKTGARPTELGVLSSEYHLFRASLFARACDVDFIGIPAKTSRTSQLVNHFLREAAGVWHYILLGGQYD